MRSFFLLLSLTGLLLFSCKKTVSDSVPASIEGSWQMLLVKDNLTNTSITKSASTTGDVIIKFMLEVPTKGTFSGKTPTNEIWPNNFTIGQNQTISTPVLSMTKVAETEWGSLFVDNIRDAQKYDLEAGQKLSLTTTTKTLIFKKL